MFKKDLEVKPSSNIKSSEKRKLQENIEKQIKGLRFPKQLSKAIFNSIEAKKGNLYIDTLTKDPVFFQLRDGNEVIPTLHILWASVRGDEPLEIPFILTHEGVVDRLVNGANLMIRGCHGPYCKGLKYGAIVAVVDYKHPNIAVAVGRCLMDLEGKSDNEVPTSGIAVQILTTIGDQLTSLGRAMDEVLENAKEATTREGDERKSNKDEEIIIKDNKEESIKEKTNGNENSNNKVNEENTIVNVLENPEEEIVSEITQSLDEINMEGDDNNQEYISEPDEYVMTTEDIDEMFKRAVLYTLSQDKLELPMLASQFISGHILVNLPPIDTDIVNIKKTSWKKTAKFLKAMEKENLLKLKGKDDKLTIISVMSRSDPCIAEFLPYRTRGKIDQNKKSNEDKHTISTETSVTPLIIKSFLKPTNNSRMIFNTVNMVYDHYYTAHEVKGIISKYIKQNPNLIDRSKPDYVEVDSILSKICKGKIIKRSELTEKLINSFSPYYVIYKEGDDESNDLLVKKRLIPRRGKIPNIKLTIESVKVGRRVVTKIEGCESFFIDLDKLASILKIKCGGSSTIVEDPKTGKSIMVQGKHDSSIIKLLQNDWGVPAKYCVVDNKVKFKGKRK